MYSEIVNGNLMKTEMEPLESLPSLNWATSHLEKFTPSSQRMLLSQLEDRFGELVINPDRVVERMIEVVKSGSLDYIIATFQDLLKIMLKSEHLLMNQTYYLETILGDLDVYLEEKFSDHNQESELVIRSLQSKIIALEKGPKPTKDANKGQKKKEKEIEKLKVKVLTLEKQNIDLASKMFDIEAKSPSAPSKITKPKIKKVTEKRSAKPTRQSLERMDGSPMGPKFLEDPIKSGSPDPYNQKKSKKKLKKIIKEKVFEKFDITLMNYNAILMQGVLESKQWLDEMYHERIYINFLELFVETLPRIEKQRHIIMENPSFVKAMLEMTFRMLKAREMVYSDQVQEMVGKPSIFPLLFKPKNKYWIKLLPVSELGGKALKKVEDYKKLVQDENLPESKFLVQDTVSKNLQKILLSITHFIRSRLLEMTSPPKQRVLSPNERYPRGKDIKNTLQILKEFLLKKRKLAETLVLCYLLIGEINQVTTEEKKYFQDEINDTLTYDKWKDSINLSDEIRKWYLDLLS